MNADPNQPRGIVDRYLGNPATGTNAATGSESLRMSDTFVSMLDLDLGKGQRAGLPYSMLLSVRFDPKCGIMLRYSTETVLIEGYRLQTLYQAITQHRLAMLGVSEDQRGFDGEIGNAAPVVTAIRIVDNAKQENAADTV